MPPPALTAGATVTLEIDTPAGSVVRLNSGGGTRVIAIRVATLTTATPTL